MKRMWKILVALMLTLQGLFATIPVSAAETMEYQNVFDKNDLDNWMKALSHNGQKLVDESNYANMFTTHKIEVAEGDVITWGMFGKDEYVMELYDEDDQFIRKVYSTELEVEASDTTVIGVGGRTYTEVKASYEVTDANCAYARILGNISTIDRFMVFINLPDGLASWPDTYIPYAKDIDTDDPLYQKSALFVGDSIVNAVKDPDHPYYGWAGRIGSAHDMDWKNAGISSATIATALETSYPENRIVNQLWENADREWDYVILQGGMNDSYAEHEIGDISDGFDPEAFDTETFSGAMEELIYTAITAYPGSKIGYIVTYATPNSNWGGLTADNGAYFRRAKEICEKWGISYIDLFEGGVEENGEWRSYSYDILNVESGENMYAGDPYEIHIGSKGYDVISPYIAEWMKTLTPYDTMPEGMPEIIDDTDVRFIYSSGDANNGGWEGGGSGGPAATEHWSNSVGATLQIRFEGDALAIYGIKAPNHLVFSVSIDGGDATECDGYAPSRTDGNQLLYSSKEAGITLENGTHTALITVLDKANEAAVNAQGISITYARAYGRVPSDKGQLQALVDEVNDMELSAYTEDSVKAFNEALAVAETILGDANAFQSDIDAAYDALKAAIEALQEDTTLAKMILKNAIDEAEEVMAAADYETIVPSVREMIESAYEVAKEVYEDSNATIAACMDAWTDLANALQYAEFKGDKSELQALVDEVNDMDLSAYTEDSVTALDEALTAAQAVLDDANALQADIDAAYETLQAAVEALQEASEPGASASEAAIAALRNMLDKAIVLGSENEALNTAITNAQAVLNKEAPSATEVVSALLDLSEAMQALNESTSTDALRADLEATIAFIEENILSNTSDVRPGKLQALLNAIDAAQDVLANEDATADQLKAANKALTKAAQELWEIVTKAELNALIEAAQAYEEAGYTAESYATLQDEIANAKAVAENDDATTAEVTNAITNLTTSIASLESITLDTSALAHEIELVTEMVANIDNYVPSTVEGLADKLADARNVLETATTQEAIDAATETLREARLNARTKADVSALEELIAMVNSLDLQTYTSASVAALNVPYTKALMMISDEAVTQEAVDQLAEQLQTAVDDLVKIDTNSTTAEMPAKDQTNTAAANMSSVMFGTMIAAGAALLMMRRRRQSK